MPRNKENIAFHSARRGDNPIYNLGRTPPSDDFFTDSLLDTSKIPTPSPTKPIDGKEPAYKPRRAIGNTKTLKAAWNASQKPAQKSLSTGDRQRPRSPQSKPAPIETTRRSDTDARKQDPTSTPSPPRRSATDLQSPASESSPPKGLTDVYQRIADEEDLAAQERVISDEEDYTEDSMAIVSDHLTGDRPLLDRIRQSRSPSSLPGSRKRSPEVRATEANKENRRDDDDSVVSYPTGISFSGDLTDQALAAKPTPHTIDRAKDRARLDRSLQKESPIALSRACSRQIGATTAELPKKNSLVAFSRAYTYPKPKLSSENVQNYHTEVEEGSAQRSSTGSIVTDRSEPPPNVPRTWGTKAKVGKDWLHKIYDRNGSRYAGPPNGQTPESSQVDWTAAAADVPLPSAEGSSTPKSISPQQSRAPSLHRQPSFDRTKEWDLNDFTGQSLQVSNTPPVRARTNVLGHLRDKEIASLEKRAVTTNRLGEIRKKDSQELLRKVSRSPSVGTTKRDMLAADLSRPISHEVKFEYEGDPVPDTPIVIYKGIGNESKDEKETETGARHPPLDREDSLSKLQKLARAMSDSPRPSSSLEDWSLIREADNGGEFPAVANGEAAKPTLHIDLSRKSSKQVADEQVTPQGAKAADYVKTPTVTGAWTDTILPETVKTVRRPKDSPKYTQTPHVNAGGWVDTPMPNGQRQSSALAPMRLEEIPEGLTDGLEREPSRPTSASANEPQETVQKPANIPKSALAGLLDKAKRKLTSQDGAVSGGSNDTLNLGDATIESLEDLLTSEDADITTLIRMGAEFEAREQVLKGTPRDDASAEALLLDRLGSRLDQLRTNIHDARKGISKLEHQVSHPNTTEDEQDLGSGNSCQTCGSPRDALGSIPTSTHTRVYLAIPLPRFFHERRRDQWLPRPTLLGWVTLAFSLWFLSESAMCDRYCHPLYAEYYEWPAEPEPRFGYVLPTMLWRWSRIRDLGPVLLGPLWTLLVAFVRILGQIFGLTDGFVDDLPSRSKGLPKPIALDERVPKAKWAPDLSMMNDEYV